MAETYVSVHADYAVNSVAASIAMEKMPLDEQQTIGLEKFRQLAEEDQKKEVRSIVEKYVKIGTLMTKDSYYEHQLFTMLQHAYNGVPYFIRSSVFHC